MVNVSACPTDIREIVVARTDLAAFIALGAALFIAVGDVVQQRSAHNIGGQPTSHRALYKLLVRSRQWWFGTGAAAIGFGLQAVALGLGSVLMVQALLVCSLLFALPIGARLARHRITAWQWMWALVLAVSVTFIVVVGDPRAGHAHASWTTWAVIIATMGPALALCLIGADVLSGPISAVLLAVASGSLWGVFAVLTKGVVDRLDAGLSEMLRAPSFTRGSRSSSSPPPGSSRRFIPVH